MTAAVTGKASSLRRFVAPNQFTASIRAASLDTTNNHPSHSEPFLSSPGKEIILAPPGLFRPGSSPRNTFSLLRYLFPNTHQRARDRFFGFRHETVPYYRLRAQSRIYQYLVKRQRKSQQKKAEGRGIVPFLRRRKNRLLGALRAEDVEGGEMTDINPTESRSGNGGADGRVRGSRRQKMYGYLKAANELRHSYQQQWQQALQDEDDEGRVPGSFPDVEIIRSGDEEMVLFPSYARKHVKSAPGNLPSGTREVPGAHDDIEHPETGDADYWKREWERYEDENAVVDVDVRGWIYTPHRGPLNRKNRLLIAVARRLSGLPAPALSSPTGNGAGDQSSQSLQMQENARKSEEEIAAKAAQSIVRKGELEAKIAWAGGYSEDPGGYDSDNPDETRHLSPFQHRESGPGHLRHSLTDSELASDDDDPALRSLAKRKSWNQPTNMSKEQLATANKHLMSRLLPFMTLPLQNTPITIFFFNEQKSRSRTIHTNDYGHFNVRASLDFIPSHIRVLAAEHLSATEKVKVTDDKGVSLISDIDDTIKHSAIASGAREIFKNTFIRDLGDLTIDGVKEWYNAVADMGVQVHYVSNSPWQLYPLLRTYFSLAGLPHGSFHLKAYTGMLQGIFEPAAERKRGSLERIMHDFPERKFVLVGDSGEADLEVYSDVVAANPNRVLAVFIRDVTTPAKKKFFDHGGSHIKPLTSSGTRTPPVSGRHLSAPTGRSESPVKRASLPDRRKAIGGLENDPKSVGDSLIDFNDVPEPTKTEDPKSYADDLLELQGKGVEASKSPPPGRPAKPSNLRGTTIESQQHTKQDTTSRPEPKPSGEGIEKPIPPPRPRRSSLLVDLPSTAAHSQAALPSHVRPDLPHSSSASNTSTLRSIRPHFLHRSTTATQSTNSSTTSNNTSAPAPHRPSNSSLYADDEVESIDPLNESYVATARRQLNNAYNALPSLRSASPAPGTAAPGTDAKPPLPRRGLTAYPSAAARWATGASGGDPAAGGDGGANPGASFNKKEELWKRRWARAEELMRKNGVVLKTWRVGSDVMDECLKLIEKGRHDLEREGGRRGGVSLIAHRQSYTASTGDGSGGPAQEKIAPAGVDMMEAGAGDSNK